MARQKTSVEYNNFTRGFITEASPLTFPENASLDEQNVNINRDGSRQRRFGFDWTDEAHKLTYGNLLSTSNEGINSFTWRSVNNDGNINFGVLQRGKTLSFFNLDEADPSSSPSFIAQFNFGVSMPDPTVQMSFASAYGKLLITVGTTDIWFMTWTGSALILNSPYNIKIRDRFGVDDGLGTADRLGFLSNAHSYNLKNQGWINPTLCAESSEGSGGTGPVSTDPVSYTFTQQGYYPSNADLIWSAKFIHLNSSLTGLALAILNLDTYSPWELTKNTFIGNTPAPRGSFIIDIFARGVARTSASGVGGLPDDITSGYIRDISSFAGRLWYAVKATGTTGTDDNSPNLGNMIFYSKASNDFEKWGQCHTENDPTSEDFSDVLASDGGYISIAEAGEIFRMVPLGESLYIFASNGVWEVFGGDTGFSSTTQTVVKISDIGTLNKSSIVDGENVIAYWAESGIWAVTISETTLRGIIVNITQDTIQTFYDDIPIEQKRETRGEYDNIAKQIVWLFNTSSKFSKYYYENELLFDVSTQSFTKRVFVSPTKPLGEGPYPIAHLKLQHLLLGTEQEDVTDSSVVVTDGGSPVTVIVSDAEQKTKTSLMYWFVSSEDGINEDHYLGGYVDFNFTDYPRINSGTDANAFILTGYLTGGDSSRFKYTPYISIKFKRTESSWTEDVLGNITMAGESGCLLQAQWEWTNSEASGRWSTPQQVYRLPRFFLLDPSHTFNFDVVNTRNKIRGRGRALSLLFSSQPLKDMYLYGWGIDVEVKGEV